MSSFKSNENIHKKEDGSYYAASANKAPPLTPQLPGNESQRKHAATLRISNRQPTERPTQTKMGIEQPKTHPEQESKPIIYFWFLRLFTLISKDQK